MNITYLILFNLGLACWLGLYALIFSRRTYFKTNRFILLGGILVAAVVPFIQTMQWIQSPVSTLSGTLAPIVVSGIRGTADYPIPAAPDVFPFRLLVAIIYGSGVAIMTLILARKLVRLYRAFKKYPRKLYSDHVHVITPEGHPVFSFAKYIFAPSDIPGIMYRHELIHIRQRHTADNLLLEIVKIFCWFNPVVYLYQRILKTVHEYLADDLATQDTDKSEYAHLLIDHLFHVPGTAITHYFFNRSLLQKRLIMLQKKVSSRRAGWKYLLIAPLLAFLIFMTTSSFALHDKVDHAVALLGLSGRGEPATIDGIVTNQSGEPLPKVTVMRVGTTRGTVTDAKGHFTLKDVPSNGMLQFSMIGYSTITATVHGDKAFHITLYEEPKRMDQLVVVGYAKEKAPSPAPKHMGTVFTFVEQMPQFPGDTLMKFLQDHIKYPQQARKLHLQGNVLVSFVVGKDGTISGAQSINDPIGGGLEQEAIRIVNAMPAWNPGRQNGDAVAVLYTLPIRFVLQ